MKPAAKDYLLVFLALIVLFGSGLFVGYRLGSRSPQNPDNKGFAADAWTTNTVQTISRDLKLNPDQQAAIRPVVRKTGNKIIGARERTLLLYHSNVLSLHKDLIPHLDETQRIRLEQNQLLMEQYIKSRFFSLLEEPERNENEPE